MQSRQAVDNSLNTFSQIEQLLIPNVHPEFGQRGVNASEGDQSLGFWYILKKKKSTDKLSSTKRPGRPQKANKVDEIRILSWVKPFYNIKPSQKQS